MGGSTEVRCVLTLAIFAGNHEEKRWDDPNRRGTTCRWMRFSGRGVKLDDESSVHRDLDEEIAEMSTSEMKVVGKDGFIGR
jgi:hypothetical protein